MLAGGAVVYAWISDFPDAANLLAYDPGNDVTLVDVEGRAIARRGNSQGQIVALDSLPAHVGNAFIAVEDRRFRYHFGIDLWGMGRATVANISAGSFVQGGSTISQQLAKNLFLKPERTIKRKVDEAILALYLESRYTKDEILTLYLNRVYFGGGVYGIEAAAERFFNKNARELTLTEAAMLAGSVKAPSRYNPDASLEAAMGRAGLVLSAMAEQGFIGEGQRDKAATTKPKVAARMATPGAGYFVDYAVSVVPSFAGKAKERLIVDTTLDLDLQAEAERALAAGLAKDGKALAASQGALVSMTLDGAVRALVGGRNYDESQFNRAIDARRQPGSAFKPFVYLAALENGHRPSDEVFDGPVSIGTWQPANYEGSYEGTITLAHALARSSNSASVQLTNEVGAQTVARIAHRLGVAGELQAVPSLALGTSELSPLDLTTGYAAFANGGDGVIPHVIVRIRTESGKVLYERKGSGLGRVIEPQHEADMVAMMTGTVTSGTGRAASLGARPVAGKTGTSQDYRDAWFVGLHVQPDHRRVDRQRFGHADEARDRRRTAGAHLQGLHAEGGTGPSRRAAHWRRYGAAAAGGARSWAFFRWTRPWSGCRRSPRSCLCPSPSRKPFLPRPSKQRQQCLHHRARKSCPACRSSWSPADARSFRARPRPKRNRNAATPS